MVIEVLEQPVFDSEIISGSTYFREPLDIILGVIWDEEHGRGDFVTFTSTVSTSNSTGADRPWLPLTGGAAAVSAAQPAPGRGAGNAL